MLDAKTTSVRPAGEAHAGPAPVTRLEPVRRWRFLNFRELWQYRELLYVLVFRDIRVRYKQSLLGAAWIVLQPMLTMVIFSIFFGRVANLPSDGLPYPVFIFTALLPWQFFAVALGRAGGSLVGNQHLITKVYFPRLLIPLAAVLAGLVDFGIAFVVLLGIMAFYGLVPTAAILTLPLFLLLALATSLAVGLWLAALNVQYRDVGYILPFLTQLWFFATPVAYSSSLVPEQLRFWYGLNPMVGVVEGFRWALLGKTGAPGPLVLVAALVVAVLLAGGLVYFRRMEQTFADVV